MNNPTAPLPASVLSAFTLEPPARFICVSAFEAAELLELISSPTTPFIPVAVRSEEFRFAVTVLPACKFKTARWTKYLLTNLNESDDSLAIFVAKLLSISALIL